MQQTHEYFAAALDIYQAANTKEEIDQAKARLRAIWPNLTIRPHHKGYSVNVHANHAEASLALFYLNIPGKRERHPDLVRVAFEAISAIARAVL